MCARGIPSIVTVTADPCTSSSRIKERRDCKLEARRKSSSCSPRPDHLHLPRQRVTAKVRRVNDQATSPSCFKSGGDAVPVSSSRVPASHRRSLSRQRVQRKRIRCCHAAWPIEDPHRCRPSRSLRHLMLCLPRPRIARVMQLEVVRRHHHRGQVTRRRRTATAVDECRSRA